jgi:hypothetical protein
MRFAATPPSNPPGSRNDRRRRPNLSRPDDGGRNPPHAYALEPIEEYPPTGAAPAGSDPRATHTRWALSLAALLAAAAFLAAAAHGLRVLTDPPVRITATAPLPDHNAGFLDDLILAGIAPGLRDGGTRDAINNGYQVCIELGRRGKNENDVVEWARRSGVPGPEMFVELAQKYFCPAGHL